MRLFMVSGEGERRLVIAQTLVEAFKAYDWADGVKLLSDDPFVEGCTASCTAWAVKVRTDPLRGRSWTFRTVVVARSFEEAVDLVERDPTLKRTVVEARFVGAYF